VPIIATSIVTAFPKEGSATLAPYLLGPCVRLDRGEQRTGQLFDRQCVPAARDHKLAELSDLPRTQLFGLVGERSQFGIKVAWFAHCIVPQ